MGRGSKRLVWIAEGFSTCESSPCFAKLRRKVLRHEAHERSSRVAALKREKRESSVSAEKRRGSRVADYRIWVEMLEKRRLSGSRV